MMTDAVEEIDWAAGSRGIPLHEQSTCQHAEHVVAAIYEDTECIKRGEVEEALRKLDARGELNDAQRDIVEEMADAIVGQLLAAPIAGIHSASDMTTLDNTVQLFDLEVEMDHDETHQEGLYELEVVIDDD